MFICFKLESLLKLGISISSYSSLGEDTTEPYNVFNLSALSRFVATPLAISLEMLSPPIFIASKNLSCAFSKIAIEVDAAPRSIQILPKDLSSKLRVANAEDNGVGMKFSISIFEF